MEAQYKAHISRTSCRQIDAPRLAQLLNVSLRTAQRYRAGDSVAPPSALQIIKLELAGHILPANWARLGLKFKDDAIITPTGELKAGMVQQYNWFLTNYRSLLSKAEQLQRHLDAIWPLLSAADKMRLIPIRHALPKRRNSSL